MLEFLFVLLDELKEAFNSWKTDWTSARASKIDTLESRLSSERAGKLDNLNRPLNSIETAVNTRASQTSVDTIRNYVDDLESRLTYSRGQKLDKLDNLDTRVSTRASQNSVDELKKLLIPNREFKFFRQGDLRGDSLNKPITLVNINGKSGEFLAFNIYISEVEKTVNAMVKVIIDGVTVIDIDYRQSPATPSTYQGALSLLIAPLESLSGGDYSRSRYISVVDAYAFLNLSNRNLSRADGYALGREAKGILPIDKIPFKSSLKIIIQSNANVSTVYASCYVNK